MIRERTKVGLDVARKEGRIGGRKPKLNKNQREDIADNVISERKSGADMARRYKVSEATIDSQSSNRHSRSDGTLRTFQGFDPS